MNKTRALIEKIQYRLYQGDLTREECVEFLKKISEIERSTEDDISELQDKLQVSQDECYDLEESVWSKDRIISDLEAEVSALTTEKYALESAVYTLECENAKLQGEINAKSK